MKLTKAEQVVSAMIRCNVSRGTTSVIREMLNARGCLPDMEPNMFAKNVVLAHVAGMLRVEPSPKKRCRTYVLDVDAVRELPQFLPELEGTSLIVEPEMVRETLSLEDQLQEAAATALRMYGETGTSAYLQAVSDIATTLQAFTHSRAHAEATG